MGPGEVGEVTYTFECLQDGCFDADLSMEDDTTSTPCPSCGEEAPQQITGGTGFVLKGGGWFRDGY